MFCRIPLPWDNAKQIVVAVRTSSPCEWAQSANFNSCKWECTKNYLGFLCNHQDQNPITFEENSGSSNFKFVHTAFCRKPIVDLRADNNPKPWDVWENSSKEDCYSHQLPQSLPPNKKKKKKEQYKQISLSHHFANDLSLLLSQVRSVTIGQRWSCRFVAQWWQWRSSKPHSCYRKYVCHLSDYAKWHVK